VNPRRGGEARRPAPNGFRGKGRTLSDRRLIIGFHHRVHRGHGEKDREKKEIRREMNIKNKEYTKYFM